MNLLQLHYICLSNNCIPHIYVLQVNLLEIVLGGVIEDFVHCSHFEYETYELVNLLAHPDMNVCLQYVNTCITMSLKRRLEY